MPDVDSFCFLVSRLTSRQCAVIVDLAVQADVHLSAWWSLHDVADTGVASGLCRLGLLEQHPVHCQLFRITLLGLAVFDALIDTGVR